MAALDWMAVVLLVLSLLLGLVRGLVFELLSLVGWVLAFVAAQWLAEDVARWLPFADPNASWRYPLGFALVFVVVVFSVGLLAALTRKLITAIGLRPVDRVLGGLFGVVRGVTVLLVLAVAVHLLALSESAWWYPSHSAIVLNEALQALKPALPQKLASYLP